MAFDSGISLTAQAREIAGSGSAKRLRRDGLVPMTIYGGKAETASGSVSKRELAAILRKSGRNAIFTLDLAGAATPVKIADMQLHPVKGSLIHVDFMRISLTEKTEFEVPVDVIGEAEGIRLLGAILDQPTHSLEIRCLPTDVPKSIEVDVTGLAVGDHLRVSDLKIDREKIEILADEDLVIVTVAAPRIVEEEAPVLEEPAEPEVIKKGKTDEEAEEKS